MDATVKEIGEVVVAELRSADYVALTIGQYEKTIRALAEYAEERGGVYSPRLGAEFSSMTISPRTGRFRAASGLAVSLSRARTGGTKGVSPSSPALTFYGHPTTFFTFPGPMSRSSTDG